MNIRKTRSKALTSLVLAASLAAAGTASAQYFTAPYGPGGTWNLYEVSNNTATLLAAHQVAVARQAQATGVSGVAGNVTAGHLVAIGSWAENAHVSLMALRHTNSSNVWCGLTDSDDAALGAGGHADAGTSQTSDQWYWAGTTGGTGPNGALRLSEGGGYQAFFTGEPNNAGTAGEDAVEFRTDGKWNDNAITVLRRYVIEYEIGAAAPVPGAVVLNPFFTARHGKTGGWNLYMISGEAETWINAHTRATGTTAGSTGLPSLAGSTVNGHLLEVATRAENSFAVSVMNKMLTFNYSIAVNGATTNTWLGLTDTDDAPISAVEAAASRTTNWIWAGTSGGAGANGAIRIEDTLEAPTANLLTFWADAATNEPNNSVGSGTPPNTQWPFGEDAGELRGDGKWNDLPHKIGPANTAAVTIVRRFIMEWPLDQAVPVAEAEILPQYYTAQTGAGGTWNLYYLDHVMQTWQAYADRYNDANFNPASFTALASMSGNTTRGHLIEISDQYEHSLAYRLAVFVAAWTGLTDNESYGGQESGNASNNPTNQVQPFWVWSGTSSANTYRRWNAGNPDDAGGNEDAGEILTTGFINDNQMNNINGVIRRGLVEWDIESATPIAGAVQFDPLMAGTRPLANTPAVGTWAIKHIYDPVHGSYYTAHRIANAEATNGRVAEGTAPVINHNDRAIAAPTGINYPGLGDIGLFGGDLPLIGDTAGVDDNNYTRVARTQMQIAAEDDYTFNLHSDDGALFRISGQTFTQVAGLGFIDHADKGTIYVPYGTGDTNTRGVVHLMPGTYDLEILSWEGGSGSAYELSFARGIYLTDEAGAGQWSLVGDPAAAYPAAVLPAFTYAPEYDDGMWGLHVVSGVGTIVSLTDAVNALQNSGGTHSYGKAPVLNHSDADRPGIGGIFAGELDLPGAVTGTNEDDFAVHAKGRLAIATAGQYTICFKGSEWAAIRIAGQAWQNVGGEFGIDPADDSTVFTYRNNSANNTNLSDFTGRAVVNLTAGCHDIEVITGDRDGGFHMELYARPGNHINTGEYTSGTANNGLANPTSNAYRLVGYKGDGTLATLGVDANGWSRRATTPVAAAPTGWPGTNIANHEIWLTANGVTTDPTARDTVNERDPQNPATDLGLPNGRDIWRQTTADDNHMVEGFDANLVVPEAGTYSIGWQGDDGGFIEIHNLPAGTGFSRFEAMGVPTPTVANAANGTVNGRIQLAVGGGNTRTMARLTFPNDGSVTYPATYPIKSLHFEGTGGCYWEIFAGPASGYGRMLTLLERNQGLATIADVDGIQLAGPDIEVLSVAWAAGPAFSFTFRSVAGITYTIWRSPDLVNWTSQGTITATGASSTYLSGPLLPTEMRYLYRASK